MDQQFDLLVIGGGINGCGIARDAAMRGLKVCIVDKEDWGWGTSAKSSMLAHGGLRYLEQFELGLVHEALQDRELMFRQAPHLVRPLEFLYPLYPHIASRRTVRAGLLLYDVLSHGKSVPKRDYLRRDEVLHRVPGINPEDLKGGATYYDGQWRSVERFVAELALSARRHGAMCLNHTLVQRLAIEGDTLHGAVVQGQTPEACARLGSSEPVTIRAHATINAAGPWVDAVLDDVPEAPRLIRGTKGIHIVVPRFVDTALIIRAKDGRTFFILPWQQHCVIGTTDTDFEGDPGATRATPDEIAYLQDAARWYFPHAPVDEVLWTYAGVRPLVNQEGLTEGNVTRRHVLHDHAKEGARNLWSVQGGKLTTYRHLAEEAVTTVCRALDRKETRLRPTREGTLPGGPLTDWGLFREGAIETGVKDLGLPRPAAAHLVDTYGARWRAVADRGGEDRLQRIHRSVPDLWCQVHVAVQEEDAITLRDVMLRRTQMGLRRDGRPIVAKRVAARMGELLGWDRARIKQELDAYVEAVQVLGVPRPTD